MNIQKFVDEMNKREILTKTPELRRMVVGSACRVVRGFPVCQDASLARSLPDAIRRWVIS